LVLAEENQKRFTFQWGLTDTLSGPLTAAVYSLRELVGKYAQ
jgi:hypothetical protein